MPRRMKNMVPAKIRAETVRPAAATERKNTEAGERLLAVLMRDGAELLKITEICQLAQISVDSYYRLFRHPGFRAAYDEHVRAVISAGALPAARTITRAAKLGNIPAAETTLKLSGMWRETQRIEHDLGPSMREFLGMHDAGVSIDVDYDVIDD